MLPHNCHSAKEVPEEVPIARTHNCRTSRYGRRNSLYRLSPQSSNLTPAWKIPQIAHEHSNSEGSAARCHPVAGWAGAAGLVEGGTGDGIALYPGTCIGQREDLKWLVARWHDMTSFRVEKREIDGDPLMQGPRQKQGNNGQALEGARSLVVPCR